MTAWYTRDHVRNLYNTIGELTTENQEMRALLVTIQLIIGSDMPADAINRFIADWLHNHPVNP